LVAGHLVVELKTVDQFAPIHLSQALSSLRATGLTLALLINFKVPVLLHGVRRVVLARPLRWRPWRPGGSFSPG
jgi:GxxExxY protein